MDIFFGMLHQRATVATYCSYNFDLGNKKYYNNCKWNVFTIECHNQVEKINHALCLTYVDRTIYSSMWCI